MRAASRGGAGKEAEINSGYFGVASSLPMSKQHRRDRRLTRNQNGKRKVVVIVRERDGNSAPAVFNSESQAASFIRARIANGTVVHADEAASWDGLHERFEIKRINHQEAYSLDGARTNMAEEYFSRLRPAEIGIHHDVAGACLLRYAQKPSWREDNRRISNGDQVSRALANPLRANEPRLISIRRNVKMNEPRSPLVNKTPPTNGRSRGRRWQRDCSRASETRMRDMTLPIIFDIHLISSSRLTILSLAFVDEAAALRFAQQFADETGHLVTVKTPEGVEIGGAKKSNY